MPEMKTYTVNGVTYDLRDPTKAPAGYGLGVASPSWCPNRDCDQAVLSGWYRVSSSNDANNPGQSGVMFVSRYSDECIYQTFYGYSSTAPIKMRSNLGTGFGEWEWVNPPMALGVEYRTTERVDSKVVYKKNVDGVIKYRLDGETEWKNQNVLMGAAPVGYGLGTTGPSVSDANHVFDTFRNGWYRTISTTANTAVTHGAGIALVYDANRAFHLLAKTTAGTMRTRYTPKSDGVFVEDLINPPMTAGYEYQTIERWNGKTVYTKLVSVGALPNNSSKSVATGATASGIFRTHLIVYAAEGNVLESPYFTSDGTLKIKHNVSNNGAVTIYTTEDYSGATGYCQIWYTKD